MELQDLEATVVEGNYQHAKAFDGEGEEAETSLLGNESRKLRAAKSSSVCLYLSVTIINLVLFTLSSMMLWIFVERDGTSLQDHWRATSSYSPIFDKYDIPMITKTTNGTLFDTNPPSVWRLRKGEEADVAWDQIGSTIGPIAVTEEEIRALRKDPSLAVKLPESYGKGANTYLASVEVFQHIHCLDSLRREISYDHYWDKTEGPAPGSALHKARIARCIDVLLQSLMCTGSVDVITWNWVEGRNKMMPDFQNKKVCRDFDGILNWTRSNGVGLKESELLDLRPPLGAKRVPMMHDTR